MKKDKNKLYGVKEAANYLNMYEEGLVRRAEVGRIEYHKLEDGEYWFSQENLDQYRKSKFWRRNAILATGILLTCVIGVGGGMIIGGKYLRKQSSEKMMATAMADFKSGNVEKALHEMRSVVLSAPENVKARIEYAKALGLSGDLKGAEEQLRKALELEPESIEAIQNLGTLLFETGRVGEASVVFEKAIDRDGENFMATYFLAASRLREGKLSEAEEIALRLVEMGPGIKASESLLAEVLSIRGKNDEALKIYEENGAEGLREKFNMAVTLHQAGKFEEAEKIYNEIVGNERIVARTYNNLAWEIVQDGRATEDEMKQAFALAVKAVTLNPADAQAADTLGWILYLSGKTPEAEKVLNKALELEPGQLDATMHMAQIFIGYNRKDEAKKILGAALGATRTEKDKLAISKLLKSIAAK